MRGKAGNGSRFAGVAVAVAVLLVAVVTAGATSSDRYSRPVRVADGNLEAFFNGAVHLEAPSKTRSTPAAVVLSAKFMTRDGSHLPALRRLKILGDKNLDIDVK